MALNIAKMTGSESSNDWQCSDPMALEIGRLSWGGGGFYHISREAGSSVFFFREYLHLFTIWLG